MARSRNNPRKIATIRPVGAGLMAAQQPAAHANDRKAAALTRDLETVKQMVQGGVRFVVVADSPYLVDEATDDYVFANAIDGALTVTLQPGDVEKQKRLTIWKTDASLNAVTVEVAGGGNVIFEGIGRLQVFLNEEGASLTVIRPAAGSTFWWTIASSGNVTA